MIAGRQRHCAGGCIAKKKNPLFCFTKQKGQGLSPRPWEGRSCPSPVAQGSYWVLLDVRLSNEKCTKSLRNLPAFQWRDEEETKSRASKEYFSCLASVVQATSIAKQTKPLVLLKFWPCQSPQPSLLQAVLHCSVPAPLSLQPVDTHFVFPPSFHSDISVFSLLSLHPQWLFLQI